MTRDDIKRMAQEAGFEEGYGNHLFPPGDYREEVVPVTDEIIRFAALVAAHEREACAKVCDGWMHANGNDCAEAIRARRET
jgi:hypothetical protein